MKTKVATNEYPYTSVGSPAVLKVKNPIHELDVVNPHLQDGVVVRGLASAVVETHGSAINPSDITVRITGMRFDPINYFKIYLQMVFEWVLLKSF